MLRKFMGAASVVILLFAFAALGIYLWRQTRLVDPSTLLDQKTFRCYAVGESMRTIGYTRAQRKAKQIKRIKLLLTADLDPLDDSKLRGELAVLSWEISNARFLRGCAEAYFTPGTTKLRESFPEPPKAMDTRDLGKILTEALQIPDRQKPHGLEERTIFHLAELSLANKDFKQAHTYAKDYAEKHPSGLYADALQLILADALLGQGKQEDALAIYQQVGRLPIGFEAHYARYRESAIQRSLDDKEGADQLLADVLKWAKRGDRAALRSVLEGGDVPPAPSQESP